MGTYRDGVKWKETRLGWDYNSHIVCMCIIMRWSRNLSASWAKRFRTSSLLCTYKLCDYYTPIPILSLFLFTPSLYAPILNLQDFSFTCIQSTTVLCDRDGQGPPHHRCIGLWWAEFFIFFFFFFSSSLFRFNTHNSKRKPYINMKLCGYVGFHIAKRLVILTCL